MTPKGGEPSARERELLGILSRTYEQVDGWLEDISASLTQTEHMLSRLAGGAYPKRAESQKHLAGISDVGKFIRDRRGELARVRADVKRFDKA